jgi:hypothetical protein
MLRVPATHQIQEGSSCSDSASEKLEDPVFETSCKNKTLILACGELFWWRGRRDVAYRLKLR